MRFGLALLCLLLFGGAAQADAIMGGTGIFKHDKRDAYLIYVDWIYVTFDDKDPEPSIVLYDREIGQESNMGARTAVGKFVDNKTLYRIKLEGDCTATITEEDGGFSVGFGNASNCAKYMPLVGHYSPQWTPPE